MAVEGTVDVALDIFGGLVTDMAPADLPPGVSWDCPDVKFVPGSVQTRPGLLSIFSPIGGTPAVNYLKSYIPPTTLLRLLVLDAAGSLWKENPQGVLSLISSAIVPATYGKSTSLFTREYLAIGDGKYGLDIPRQYDDTNLDRVSQVGPGIAPFAADESVSQSTSSESQPGTVAISTATESGALVTITTSAGHGLVVGQNVVVSGVGIVGYNNGGTNPAVFSVVTVPSSTTFTYIVGASGLAASSGGTVQSALATYNFASAHGLVVGQLVTTSGITPAGYNVTAQPVFSVPSSTSLTLNLSVVALGAGGAGTMANAGNVSTGVHKLSVVFVTRQGYITAPAPPSQWTASGNKRVTVTGIPTGPTNIAKRILLFTLAGQSSYFYSKGITGIFSSNFIIPDNSTTTITVDFSDVGLAAEINADDLFNLIELGECSGVTSYASRLFWWGERVTQPPASGRFVNLTFDGGFNTFGKIGAITQPNGWTAQAAGGSEGTGANAVWGSSYHIHPFTGSGLIQQSAYQDAFGVPLIQPNVDYSVRVRIQSSGAPNPASVVIQLTSVIGGFTSAATAALPAFGVPTSFNTEYNLHLTAPLATVPSDTLLQVFATGTDSTRDIYIDNIEIYPTNQPFNQSTVRASLEEDPESYDGVTGFLNVNENDGFAVRSAFVIRENLYFVKEHGIYSTQDDGTNEPSGWTITEVSRRVGTPSVNGVDVGQDWAIIAERTGAYFFSGGQPHKISQEIQPTWDRINWAAGQTLWVKIDLQNRRVYFGVPMDGATSPNKILMMDYRGVEMPDEIPTATPIHTSYSGRLLVLEKSRKWSIWNIAANSAAIVERFDGTQQTFLGNNSNTGKIYQLSDTVFTDDGATIPGYYNTYFHFSHDLEQAFQVGSHNKLFTYLSMFVEGSGTLVLTAIPPGNLQPVPVAAIPLANPAVRDIEFPINVTAVRAAFKATTANNGDWFRLARFITNAIKHPTAPVRGWN